MEKTYDIYINGEIAMQNISMEEENATVDRLIEALSDVGASEEEKSLKEKIENGASVEFQEI